MGELRSPKPLLIGGNYVPPNPSLSGGTTFPQTPPYRGELRSPKPLLIGGNHVPPNPSLSGGTTCLSFQFIQQFIQPFLFQRRFYCLETSHLLRGEAALHNVVHLNF